MKHIMTLFLIFALLLGGCCGTPKLETSSDKNDVKIQQLEKRVGLLEKRLNDLDGIKVLPLN